MYPVLKRAGDIIISMLLGLVFLPFGLLIALIIICSSGGPVFFTQTRIGKECKPFTIHKFCSMRPQDQKQPLDDMERMTRIGKILRNLSLDEVPQLINIIKGDMSLIGPRPLLEEYVPLYSAFQMRRHEVRPGITGYAQVNGRNAISWQEKFEYDVYYVDHLSFFLDIKILFKTISAVLKRSGVDQEKNQTMEKFTGNTGAE